MCALNMLLAVAVPAVRLATVAAWPSTCGPARSLATSFLRLCHALAAARAYNGTYAWGIRAHEEGRQ